MKLIIQTVSSLLLFLLAIICILLDTIWLGTITLLMFITYLSQIKSIINAPIKTKRLVIKLYLATILLFSLWIFRLFLFELYYIPSTSMENTLKPGDVVLMKKTFDRRVNERISEISHSSKIKSRQLVKRKISKERALNIERNDVLIFEWEAGGKAILVKRCIGLPGETILIDSSIVFIDDEIQPVPKTSIQLYYTDIEIFNENRNFILASSTHHFRNHNKIFVGYQNKQIDSLESYFNELNIKKYVEEMTPGEDNYCFSAVKKWTIDFFGPLLIPFKGMRMELDSVNFARYSYTINTYERVTISREDSKTYIDGKEMLNYTFKNDYYFMMGDNRHNSNDSRFIGVIPADRIVGKTQRILYSYYNHKFNWDRFLKKLE